MKTYSALQFERKQITPFNPVKVAVIDNGIDSFTLRQKSLEGISFVYHYDEESNWWLASDSHGTQMANLVNHIDPYCKLYIAKVGDKKENLMPDSIVKVFQPISFRGSIVLMIREGYRLGSEVRGRHHIDEFRHLETQSFPTTGEGA